MSIVSYSWDLDNPLDRVFNNLVRDWDGARREVRSGRAWTPAMDVHENEKEYIVKAELPVRI
jgi:HSP20 family molecular chaperone IbpA